MDLLRRLGTRGSTTANRCAGEDIEAVCASFGLNYRRSANGTHQVVSHPGVHGFLTIPAHRKLKPLYLRLLAEMISKVEEL